MQLELNASGKCSVNRPMVDILGKGVTSREIKFYSDASVADELGYGCLLDNKWIFGSWEPGYVQKFKPSIEYLELFTLCAGILTWESELQI